MSDDMAWDTAGDLAIETYKRAAKVLNLAVIQCESDGVPLNEIQCAAINLAVIQSFDGMQAELAAQLSVDAARSTGDLGWLLGHDIGGLSGA